MSKNNITQQPQQKMNTNGETSQNGTQKQSDSKTQISVRSPKHPQELVLLSQAYAALSKATTIDEVRLLRDQAESIKAYVRKARLGRKLFIDASIVKIQAERKLGVLLKQMQLAKATPGNQHSSLQTPQSQVNGSIRLDELGITKSDSSRYQQIAAIPDDIFEKYVQAHIDSGTEITTSALLRIAKQYQATIESKTVPQHTLSGESIDDLETIVKAGIKYSTIYADPPWPYRNQSSRAANKNHYPILSIEKLIEQPISKIVNDKAHLHLWTTNAFIEPAIQMMQAWGFQYKSCFVWVKPQMGLGNYWRVSHEFMLLGVRGGLRFRSRKQRSWQKIPRTKHSRKPTQIRELIESVSPGPYLELYARQSPPSKLWTSYGNQIE